MVDAAASATRRSGVDGGSLQDTVVRARVLDRVPGEHMPAVIASADALLVPLRHAPVFALTVRSKLQSSLASGRPILAVLEGEGARLVEESGAGFVTAPGDPQVLAHAASRLAATPRAERQRMGMAGRRFFEAHFERQRVYALVAANLHTITRHAHAAADAG